MFSRTGLLAITTLILGYVIMRHYTEAVPLNVLNRNPLNIKHNPANEWEGQIGINGKFAVFQSPVYGFRAAAKILKSYSRRGILSIRDIIETWAPASDKNYHNANYIAFVVQRLNELSAAEYTADSAVRAADLPDFLFSMALFEGADQTDFSFSDAEYGVELAGV